MGYPEFIKSDINYWLQGFRFSTTIKIRFSETDAYGHVNNVSYFTYFEQARLDYLEHLGLVDELMKSPNNLIVTANLECHYLSQLHYGQLIDVYVRIARMGKSSFDLEYAIKDKKKGILAAVGKGTIVHINKQTGKSEALPAFIKEKIVEYEKIN
ncbi:hypothetical protein BHF71_04125 [Vulcanibacillus modesticaldus]|uniref:Thioesterase domain-containing protein n=1 Tax=Vulcanibacillus modesticaldus TaxID=337097 RepID=A0A1D2YSB3_9BACI|nr:thioesterase family protein [Vulcanibacillus modesticaldus]OEF96922.1 hypothetical protein BHF71_04125 [Vulcanibacillus modesticaldus]